MPEYADGIKQFYLPPACMLFPRVKELGPVTPQSSTAITHRTLAASLFTNTERMEG
jgi:hypothetical protein